MIIIGYAVNTNTNFTTNRCLDRFLVLLSTHTSLKRFQCTYVPTQKENRKKKKKVQDYLKADFTISLGFKILGLQQPRLSYGILKHTKKHLPIHF